MSRTYRQAEARQLPPQRQSIQVWTGMALALKELRILPCLHHRCWREIERIGHRAGPCRFGLMRLTTRLFGKTEHGKLKLLNKLTLLPYLALIWTTWHAVRVLQRESAFDKVTPTLWIGRRLLGSEKAPPVQVVLDLTCEFDEPRGIRETCSKYIALPILDRGVPFNAEVVLQLVRIA